MNLAKGARKFNQNILLQADLILMTIRKMEMSKKYWRRGVWGVILPGLFCGMLVAGISCSNGKKPQNENTKGIRVFVSIPPQKDFVRRIGGGRVEVEILIKSGAEPHTFEPTAKQIVRLGRAKAYFRIGVPFENRLLEKIRSMFPQLEVVDTGRGIKRRKIGRDDGKNKKHQYKGADPHIWLDPMLVKIQGTNICRALSKLDPPNADYYAANLRMFLGDLDRKSVV